MPIPVTIEQRERLRAKNMFSAYYIALLLLSLHWACVLYINSSFLEQFVSHRMMSILYSVSALVTIGVFLNAPNILTRIGNIQLLVICTAVEFSVLMGMAFTHTPLLSLLLFVIHQAVVPLLLYSLDIIIETLNGVKEERTGRQRGILLTIMSLTTACAPIAVGYIVGEGDTPYTLAYCISAFILIPFVYIVLTYFWRFTDPVYETLRLHDGLMTFWRQHDVRNVFFAHFLLQLFFTWMVIYTPVYLAETIGFTWKEIGAILSVGLSAYVLFEYLIGYLADTYIGEKEMMALGFGITAISTSWFIFLDGSSIVAWMVAMFLTRVGASLIETTTESYFFKHTQGKDSNLIGLFRITRPLSYLVGAILGVAMLSLFSFTMLFAILGALMIPGLFFAMALKDTK